MLGNDRFAFETPNVIDPGDLPPSAPRRDDNDEEYQETRESTRRLLNDISDLDLTPTASSGDSGDLEQPYDPYHDEPDHQDDDEMQPGDDQAARNYAAALLLDSTDFTQKRKTKQAAFGRTVQLDAPASRHLVRKRLMRMGGKIGLVVAGMAFLTLLVALLARKHDTPTATNTSVPSSTRLAYIHDFLAQHGISALSHLQDTTTPQSKAAVFMALDTKAMPKLPQDPFQDVRFVQRYVLAVLYYAFQGPQWESQLSFLTQEHECSWNQPESFDDLIEKTTAVGVSCDPEKLVVRDILLPHHTTNDNKDGLQGSIPSELAFLLHLELFSVPDNQITGSLPSELRRLTHLEFLDLKYNQITGTLPSWIGQDCLGLEVLGLSNNLFQGALPSNLQNLVKLHTLAIDDNQFTGTGLPDVVNALTNLEYLYADRNFFTGEIQPDFMDQHQQLHVLDISNNDFTSTQWPEHLFRHPTLHVLDFANNRFASTLPEVIETNHQLEFFSLRNNQMYGEIPPSLQAFELLQHLDLHNNSFTGILPREWREMSQLTYLHVGHNDWTPTNQMPGFLDQLSNLRELSLANSQLSGTIPAWIATYLPELRFIDLSQNQLHGSIPDNLLGMDYLDYLFLYQNQLTGQIPQQGELFRVLAVHQNPQLQGDLNFLCTAQNTESDFLLAADCDSVQCDQSCCPTCCASGADSCFEQELAQYVTQDQGLWEFGYERPPFGFDPDILDEVGLFSVMESSKVNAEIEP